LRKLLDTTLLKRGDHRIADVGMELFDTLQKLVGLTDHAVLFLSFLATTKFTCAASH
jgi:hypothetical protein